MLLLVVQHIDALIMLAGGLFACFRGYRAPRADLALTVNQRRATKVLRVCGPLLVLFGILRFFLDGPA